MSNQPLRFAILSPSRWGRLLLDAAAASDKLSFAGVYSRNSENATEITDKYGGRVYPAYDAILADAQVEAVLLPTPNFLHYDQAMAAFEAGKHVFIEKPIANHVAEAEQLQQTSREKGLVLAVGMQGRRTGAARTVKRMLDAGQLGRIALVVATHGAPLLQGRDASSWYTSREKAPGGPLDQLGVHYFDLLRYFFGPVVSVTGRYTDHVTPHDVPDAAAAVFEMADGTMVVYTTHQVSAYVSNLSIYGSLGAIHFRRFGQELLWEDVIPSATSKKEGPQIRPLEFEGPHPFTTALQEELEDFADCIRTGGTPLVGAVEGIAALRVARAVMEAHESGHTIRLDT
ncbi:MAG: Gfo/Idh/MocA family oxidoreductase [Anaerolineae bacterium]|nr:Gfo/Idh/MocA family oxidoreductase [Anaerolineae bacterium]